MLQVAQTIDVLSPVPAVACPLTLEDLGAIPCSPRLLQAVQTALKNDASLQEIVSTPLMLNIVVLAFRETSIKSILSVEDPTKQRRVIFEKYVEYVLKRRGPKSHYSREQTMHWLTWLAQQLEKHNQTEFYLERMQQDLLPDTARNQYNHTLFRVIYGIETAAIAGLYAWLRGGKVGNVTGVSVGILGWLGAGPGNSVLGWMAKGLGGGIEGGGMLGIIFVLAVFLTTTIIDSYSESGENWSWKDIQKGIASGLRNALLSGGITASRVYMKITLRQNLPDLFLELSATGTQRREIKHSL